MPNVLITGGAGFIGSHLVEYFTSRDNTSVSVLDNLSTGCRANLDGLDCRFIEGSIENPDTVRAACEDMDYVFHLAALVSVPESMQAPDRCVRINVEGTLNVLRAAAEAGCRKLIFSSSCAVYGDAAAVPVLKRATVATNGCHFVDVLCQAHPEVAKALVASRL